MKNAIQEERMRSYFIDATKELLKGEGLKSVSVRSVAQKAGYSFATIYNYFRDSSELVFECVKDFLEECFEHVKSSVVSTNDPVERIKLKTKAYANYFVQYPGTFELFFIERPSDLAGKQSTLGHIAEFYQKLCADEWEELVSTEKFSEEELRRKQKQLNYVVLGMLTYYLNRNSPSTYAEFIDQLEEQVKFIFD